MSALTLQNDIVALLHEKEDHLKLIEKLRAAAISTRNAQPLPVMDSPSSVKSLVNNSPGSVKSSVNNSPTDPVRKARPSYMGGTGNSRSTKSNKSSKSSGRPGSGGSQSSVGSSSNSSKLSVPAPTGRQKGAIQVSEWVC